MAEKECSSELRDIHICKAENGFKICCCYENTEKSLSQRAGWVPCGPCETKDYVEKSVDSVVKRVKELLNEKHCSY